MLYEMELWNTYLTMKKNWDCILDNFFAPLFLSVEHIGNCLCTLQVLFFYCLSFRGNVLLYYNYQSGTNYFLQPTSL